MIPPFGKPLKLLIDNNQIPNNSVYVYVGNKAWEKGKLSSLSRPDRTLALPPNHSPLLYDWPVNGCDILIIETSQTDMEYVETLVKILFSHRATKVTLLSFDLFITIYKKEI